MPERMKKPAASAQTHEARKKAAQGLLSDKVPVRSVSYEMDAKERAEVNAEIKAAESAASRDSEHQRAIEADRRRRENGGI
jgi:hypothetical protein